MKNHEMLVLPLQFFAEDETAEQKQAEDKTETKSESENKEDSSKENKTYSQSELDSVVSKAINTYSKKKEAEFQKVLEKAVKDGIAKEKTYAELTEEQKKEKDIQDKLDALQKKEEELNRRERYSSIVADLNKEQLPAVMADYLVMEPDNEKVKDSIKQLKKVIDDAVNEKVKEALRSGTPQKTDGTQKGKTLIETLAEKKNKQNETEAYNPWAKI